MVLDGTLACRFVMPFVRNAEVRLSNRGATSVGVHLAAIEVDQRPLDARSRHFHARFRDSPEWPLDGPIDWRLAELSGEGELIGTALAVRSSSDRWWRRVMRGSRSKEKHFTRSLGSVPRFFGCAWGFPHASRSPWISVATRESGARTSTTVGQPSRGFACLTAFPLRVRCALILCLFRRRVHRPGWRNNILVAAARCCQRRWLR